MEYIVEVRDIYKGIVIFADSFDNANTAYHYKRILEDTYNVFSEDSTVSVILIEP